MERTEFQQMMAELKEKSERRRYDALRKKYAVAPDFTNMSLREEQLVLIFTIKQAGLCPISRLVFC